MFSCCCPEGRKAPSLVDPQLLKAVTFVVNSQNALPPLKTRGFFPNGLDLVTTKLLIANKLDQEFPEAPPMLKTLVWEFSRPTCIGSHSLLEDKRREPVVLDATSAGDFKLWAVNGKLVIADPQGLGVELPGSVFASLMVWIALQKLHGDIVGTLGRAEAKNTQIAMEYGFFVVKAPAETDWFILVLDVMTGEAQYGFRFPDAGCFISPEVYFGLGTNFPNPVRGCFHCVCLTEGCSIQMRGFFNDPLDAEFFKWRTKWLKNDASIGQPLGFLMFEIHGRLRNNQLARRSLRLRFVDVQDADTFEFVEPRTVGERTAVFVGNLENVDHLIGRLDAFSLLAADGDSDLYSFYTFDRGEQVGGGFTRKSKLVFVDSQGVMWVSHHDSPTEISILVADELD
jgi:hypothetical protein